MATPTKSNRGKDRSTLQGFTQSSNEEDDSKTRLLNSEIEMLKRDWKKNISAEETLKVILRDSSNRLTMMSTQAEQLAGEKRDAENHIKQLEREKIDLQEQVVAPRGINAMKFMFQTMVSNYRHLHKQFNVLRLVLYLGFTLHQD